MEIMLKDLRIYKGKTVLVTGHTGFKGAWLSLWLKELGANVIGFSLPRWNNDRLFKLAGLSKHLVDYRGDIRDPKTLNKVFTKYKPCVVFHLAAQPLVRRSYIDPIGTFDTNVIGTCNVLECMKLSRSIRAGVMITTDKVYKNVGYENGYKETDEFGGHDPYSTSKAAAELVIESYKKSFLDDSGKLTASARSGNVIGGGDYAEDRLMPDCIRSLKKNKPFLVRHPKSTRPWQHVIEPVYGYLLLGAKLLEGKNKFASSWNFGPQRANSSPVSKVADLAIESWGRGRWKDVHKKGDLHEAKYLSLDISKAKKILKWIPKWNIEKTVEMTVQWYKSAKSSNAYQLCKNGIEEYMNEKC